MSNPVPYGVKLQIGGRRRTLRFDGNAIIEAQEATDCPDLLTALDRAQRMDVRIIRALLWAALLHEDPDLELREVGSWIGEGGTRLDKVIEPIAQAVTAAMTVDTGEPADPTTAAPSTGAQPSEPESPQG